MSDPSKSEAFVPEEPKPSGPLLPPVDSGSPRAGSLIILETPKRTWRSHLWDTWDKPPEERHLLFKLDLALMVYTVSWNSSEILLGRVADSQPDPSLAWLGH